jgi:hypothetical protein
MIETLPVGMEKSSMGLPRIALIDCLRISSLVPSIQKFKEIDIEPLDSHRYQNSLTVSPMHF